MPQNKVVFLLTPFDEALRTLKGEDNTFLREKPRKTKTSVIWKPPHIGLVMLNRWGGKGNPGPAGVR